MTDDDVRRYFQRRWADHDRVAAVALLEVVDVALYRAGIDYVLYAGTLLGYLRYRRFLEWDDDIDLLTVGHYDRATVATALAGAPVAVVPHPYPGIHKVFFTASPRRTNRPWAYPFVDIAAGEAEREIFWHDSSWGGRDIFPLTAVLPTRRDRIEGVTVSVPNDPAGVCVAKYGQACLATALPPSWDHNTEQPTRFPAERVALDRIEACLGLTRP